MDVVLLSRIQFGLTSAFHIVFPTLTISLALKLVVVEWLWLSTQNALYYRMSSFFLEAGLLGIMLFARTPYHNAGIIDVWLSKARGSMLSG